MELKGKKILVVGLGKTGIATARFLLSRGAVVSISDSRKRPDIPKDVAGGLADIEAGEHTLEMFLGQDLIVVSPGVPLFIRPVIEAQARGIEVLSEIELAYRFLSSRLVAVTGTNGKTTTTSLLQHMFALSGKTAFVGGNIGTPLIECLALDPQPEYCIAEISSFQLEGIKHFKPYVSVLLNVTEDHLDRYPSFSDYAYAKSKILLNQTETDHAILNYDDPYTQKLAGKTAARPHFFSTQALLDSGSYYNGAFHFIIAGRETQLSADKIRLRGTHNHSNILAAATVGLLCGISPAVIQKSLETFTGLAHRMEHVDAVNGVHFFNDSKGTNVGACVKSLESLPSPIILIAGGKDKGGSYQPLLPLIQQKVKTLILLGEAKQRMADALGAAKPTFIAESLEEAVKTAAAKATPGDQVLFSPACSSFDMFNSYEHRGDCFKELIKQLKDHG